MAALKRRCITAIFSYDICVLITCDPSLPPSLRRLRSPHLLRAIFVGLSDTQISDGITAQSAVMIVEEPQGTDSFSRTKDVSRIVGSLHSADSHACCLMSTPQQISFSAIFLPGRLHRSRPPMHTHPSPRRFCQRKILSTTALLIFIQKR